MIKYYNKLILSMSEIEDHPSLLIHGLTGCMFKCYHCFNYEELIEKEHTSYYTIKDLINYIERQSDLFEYILFSGGEYMLAPLEFLIEDLTRIKQITNKPIIVYTTGIELAKMKKLDELRLVDGYHIDMKLPYHLLTDQDFDLVEMTMGIRVKDLSLFNKLLESITFVAQTDRGFSQIRSVKYPFLDESAFHECKSFIDMLNDKYNKNIPYFANKFIYPETKKKEG